MHQIRFRLGLCPRPRWGAYSAPPGPLAGFKGPTSKGGEGGEGTGGEGREGRGGKVKNWTPLVTQTQLRRWLFVNKITHKLLNSFSQNLVYRWHIGEEINHCILQVMQISASVCYRQQFCNISCLGRRMTSVLSAFLVCNVSCLQLC